MLPQQAASAKLAGDLYQESPGAYVFISGGGGENGKHGDGSGTTEGSVLAHYLEVNRKVPPDRICLHTTPKATRNNLEFAEKMMDELRLRRLVVVANYIHSPRTRFLAWWIGLSRRYEVDVVASYSKVRVVHDVLWEIVAVASAVLPQRVINIIRRYI
jgi:uncharacterized SAM-binding protein YcdF (DUF218 family)